MEKTFSGCKAEGQCTIDTDNHDIEGDAWQAYDINSGHGEDKEIINDIDAFMICTKGDGVIHFINSGQQLKEYAEGLTLELGEIERLPASLQKYYENNKKLINQIKSTNLNGKFDFDIDNFKKIYKDNKGTYEEIAKETGVPPELIAALHYRESACDFNTYLHNGQELGKPTTIVPKGRIFYDFEEAAIDALQSELKSKNINLTEDDSIVMLATFAEVYNGIGYTKHHTTPSPYVYSGTDIYVSVNM